MKRVTRLGFEHFEDGSAAVLNLFEGRVRLVIILHVANNRVLVFFIVQVGDLTIVEQVVDVLDE